MPKENNFLPDKYEVPSGASNYMKFKQGDNTFRILSDAILGYEYWTTDNKPVRVKDYPTHLPKDIKYKDGKPTNIRHFWAMTVWNYDAKAIQILEITQDTIQKPLKALAKNPKWGHPSGYDIVVNRVGEGMNDTEYAVSPEPHSEITREISEAYEAKKVNLNALYDGADPFAIQAEGKTAKVDYPEETIDPESIPF